MVIGKGMMAKVFSVYETSRNIMIFASGVSDSQEKSEIAFKREEDLLRKCLATAGGMIFIYFSTCSIYDQSLKENPYVQHKIKMEEIIKGNAKKYLIFRLPQVVGKTTNNTLINFLYNMVKSGQQFEVWTRAYRNLLDCEDAFKICSYIIDKKLFLNRTVNIASPIMLPAPMIVELIEKILDKKGNYVLVDKGGNAYTIDLKDVMPVIKALNLVFNEQYPERVIRKYYGGI